MIKTLTITYENENIPVMYVAENNFFSTTVMRIFKGEKAEQIYKELTGQNLIIKAGSEDKECR